MKVILFGSNGMLGSYIETYLTDRHELVSYTRKDLDLSVVDEAEIISFLTKNVSSEDVIINASGIIKQRKYNSIEMLMVNSIFPQILSRFKKQVGCNVIHITTDCVFSGKDGNYVETDSHDCLDDYGKTKSLGENNGITNIRTSIIGEEIYNKLSLLEWVLSMEGKTLNGYTNHLWNGVTCLELSKFIDKIIENNLYWTGVRHIFSPDTVSKSRLIQMIRDVYELNIVVNETNAENKCYRNLSTNFGCVIQSSLYEQLQETRAFNLKKTVQQRGKDNDSE
tara:strand:- start:145837 stop:146676 length:840 start_codon:yes stop_codon:yes gene_type:complete